MELPWLPAGVVWVDSGCGTGVLVERALQTFPETKFYLADPSQSMLAVASEKLGRDSRVEVLEAVDSRRLVLPTEANVVAAIQAHHYMHEDERRASIENCYRLMRQGGMFIIFENIRPFTEVGTEIGKSNWGRFQIAHGKSHGEAGKHLQRFGKGTFL
jgi:tRNA (cmo5U34)-methyltransferase